MSPAHHFVVGAFCGYEAAAIFSGKLPTLSSLQRKHPILGALIVGWLAIHFLRYEREPTPLTRWARERLPLGGLA